MSWAYRISRQAAKQLRKLPRDRQEQLARAFQELQDDPLRGDVRSVKSGKFRGALRKRVGRYRIIFALDHERKLIDIAAIIMRSEKTYR